MIATYEYIGGTSPTMVYVSYRFFQQIEQAEKEYERIIERNTFYFNKSEIKRLNSVVVKPVRFFLVIKFHRKMFSDNIGTRNFKKWKHE